MQDYLSESTKAKKRAQTGTEEWEQECDNSDNGDDFEAGPDVPFPGEEGLKAMMEDSKAEDC